VFIVDVQETAYFAQANASAVSTEDLATLRASLYMAENTLLYTGVVIIRHGALEALVYVSY